MAIASSKYPILGGHDTRDIFKILQWKIEEGFSNQIIYEYFPRQTIETIYFYDGGENEPIRLPMIGKFNIEEIKGILSLPSFDSDQSKAIIQILEKSGKKH